MVRRSNLCTYRNCGSAATRKYEGEDVCSKHAETLELQKQLAVFADFAELELAVPKMLPSAFFSTDDEDFEDGDSFDDTDDDPDFFDDGFGI